jgi:phage-related baseplate assembly protein
MKQNPPQGSNPPDLSGTAAADMLAALRRTCGGDMLRPVFDKAQARAASPSGVATTLHLPLPDHGPSQLAELRIRQWMLSQEAETRRAFEQRLMTAMRHMPQHGAGGNNLAPKRN